MPSNIAPSPMAVTDPLAGEQNPLDLLPESNYEDYDYAKIRLQKIIDTWTAEEREVLRRRALRYIKVDKASLEAIGKFKPDEIYVPIRLIDQNIKSEQPRKIEYITQSRRAAVFKPKNGLRIDGVEKLETNFTDVAHYLGFEKPFIRVIDGSDFQGWDSVEVVFDENASGHFIVEQVGHDRLLFDYDAEDVQNQELVIRIEEKTSIQLKTYVKKYGFDAEQVSLLIKSEENNEGLTQDVQYRIYKCFYRSDKDETIYVGYYGGQKCTDWLKAPEPLFMGRRDYTQPKDELQPDGSLEFPKIPETEFPFYLLPYTETEESKITQVRGRGFLDEPAQDGASALQSAIIVGVQRACGMYGSTKNNPASVDSNPPKQIEVPIKPNTIWDKELNWTHMPYPEPTALAALQSLTTYNKTETAKVDHAALNKKDSRQTATAVQAATQEAQQLTSVQVTILSTFIRQVYTRCWQIYKNRVLQNKIKILDPELKALFVFEYEILSSGDFDVVKRQEKSVKQMQAWPVVSQTPIAQAFFEDIIRNAFPEDATKYINILNQVNPQQLVIGLYQLLAQLVTDGKGNLAPFAAPFAQQLQVLNQQVQTYLQQSFSQQPQQVAAQKGQQAQEEFNSASEDVNNAQAGVDEATDNLQQLGAS